MDRTARRFYFLRKYFQKRCNLSRCSCVLKTEEKNSSSQETFRNEEAYVDLPAVIGHGKGAHAVHGALRKIQTFPMVSGKSDFAGLESGGGCSSCSIPDGDSLFRSDRRSGLCADAEFSGDDRAEPGAGSAAETQACAGRRTIGGCSDRERQRRPGCDASQRKRGGADPGNRSAFRGESADRDLQVLV